jgi:hypothetical protein
MKPKDKKPKRSLSHNLILYWLPEVGIHTLFYVVSGMVLQKKKKKKVGS